MSLLKKSLQVDKNCLAHSMTIDLLLKSEAMIKQSTQILHPPSTILRHYFDDLASTPKLNISRLGWAIENIIGFVNHPGLKSSKSLVTLNKAVCVL